MLHTATPAASVPFALPVQSVNSKLRELLAILDALRTIREPLTSPEGLKASLELLLRLAEFAGIERSWTDRVRTVIDNPRVFEIALAIVRYLHGLVETEQVVRSIADHAAADVAAQDFFDLLPLILEIIALVRELRRGTSAAE